MGRAKYIVELGEEERVQLRNLLRRGKAPVRMVARARVLLRADEGYTDDAIVHHGVLDEGVSFIGKPYSPSALARKIRDVLDKA